MLNIIKSDLYRIFRGKSLYIVTAIIIFMAVISAITLSPGHIGVAVGTGSTMTDPDTVAKIAEAKTLGEFRDVMKEIGTIKLDAQIIGQNSNLYYFFIVFVVVIITSDFSNKSVKNTLSSAISRREYYFSKLITVIGMGTVLVLFNDFINYVLNYVINGKEFASEIGYITKISLIQIPVVWTLICMLVCIAFFVRKTSVFNTISIPLLMILQVIAVILFAILRETPKWYTDFELQYVLSNMANEPSNSYIIKCFVLSTVYIVAFVTAGYCAFKNAEVK
ncbi:MAG: hypothetical protein K6G88_15970 [Lachnospiraceae bacterium]|nr:hypothetical protein [Lachnospiraceae bacterium]